MATKKKKGRITSERPPADEATPPHTLATTTAAPAKGPNAVSGPRPSDDAEAAVGRVEGRTSDAANRSADVQVDEIPPDLSAGNKPSDGGPEVYPFPPQGDVDVATVPTKKTKGEFLPPIPIGASVKIKADGKRIDKRFDGRTGLVTSSATFLCNCDYSPRTHEHQSPDASIGVSFRDETGALLTVTAEDVETVELSGRPVGAVHG